MPMSLVTIMSLIYKPFELFFFFLSITSFRYVHFNFDLSLALVMDRVRNIGHKIIIEAILLTENLNKSLRR